MIAEVVQQDNIERNIKNRQMFGIEVYGMNHANIEIVNVIVVNGETQRVSEKVKMQSRL